MKIRFNEVLFSDRLIHIINDLLLDNEKINERFYTNKCLDLLRKIYPNSNLLLTHSGTAGLELIANLLNITFDDEVILPSFTFVSTANAFVSRGAKPVFVDIDLESYNLDINQVEKYVTPKTKAIVAVHYGGHSCNLINLKEFCKKHRLFLIEDAAMAFGNKYNGQRLGSIGDFGIISFDNKKQISSMQGGLVLINHPSFVERANILYNLGTNKIKFLEGQASYYEWIDIGSKYQMSELNSVVLYDQLNNFQNILKHRNFLSKIYFETLQPLASKGLFRMMQKEYLDENFHEFYIVLNNKKQRDDLANFLKSFEIEALFHYVPLHLSLMGAKYCQEELPNTTLISDCLIRLPLHIKMSLEDVRYVVDKISLFFCEIE